MSKDPPSRGLRGEERGPQPLARGEQEEQRAFLRAEISKVISAGRNGRSLSVDEQAALDSDLGSLKNRFQRWVNLEKNETTISEVVEQLNLLDAATSKMRSNFACLNLSTLSILLDSIEQESPLLELNFPYLIEPESSTSEAGDPVIQQRIIQPESDILFGFPLKVRIVVPGG